MDWLEEEYYDKMLAVGIPSGQATMLARLAAQLERNRGVWERIKSEGFDGFCRWIEIQCKDIYYTIKGVLSSLWDWIKSKLG